jgi:hypothetical protein
MAAAWTAYLPRTVIRESHIALAADGQHYRSIRSADGKILHEGLIERGAVMISLADDAEYALDAG